MRKFYYLVLTTLFLNTAMQAESVLVVGVESTNADYASFMVEIQKVADSIATLDGFTTEIKDADVVTSGSFDFSAYDVIVITESASSSTISKIGTYVDDVVKALPVVNMKMYAIHDGKNGWDWCPSADFLGDNSTWDDTKIQEQAIMKILSLHDIFGDKYQLDQEVLLFNAEWGTGAHFQSCTFANSAFDDIAVNDEAIGSSIVIEANNPDKPSFMMHAIEESATSKRNVIWGVHAVYSEATEDFYFILKNSVLWSLKKDPIKYVGVNKIKNNMSLNVYPNPASENINVNFYNSVNNSTVKISLYDITGKKVMETMKNLPVGIIQETIKLDKYEQGMYMIKVESDNGASTLKISVN